MAKVSGLKDTVAIVLVLVAAAIFSTSFGDGPGIDLSCSPVVRANAAAPTATGLPAQGFFEDPEK